MLLLLLLVGQGIAKLSGHIFYLTKALGVKVFGIDVLLVHYQFFTYLPYLFKVLEFTFVCGLVTVHWLPFDLIDVKFNENRLTNLLIRVQVVLLAKLVINVVVVLGAVLDPDRVSLPHGSKGLANMLVIAGVSHVEFALGFSLFIEVDQLTVVESGLTHVIDYVRFLDFSLEA